MATGGAEKPSAKLEEQNNRKANPYILLHLVACLPVKVSTGHACNGQKYILGYLSSEQQ